MSQLKENITISTITSKDMQQVTSLANLYAKVFAGPPWNEVSKCSVSGTYYGSNIPVGSPCPDCDLPLLEAYPQQTTIQYILSELSKPNPIGLLIYLNSELAGFSWGYQSTPEAIATNKWRTPQMQDKIIDLFNNAKVKQMFYGSETGIDPKFQGMGLGKKLVQKRLELIKQKSIPCVAVRTNVNSPMYGICLQTKFDQILGPVAERQSNSAQYVVTNKTINGLDIENQERVIFLYRQFQD